MRKLLLASAGLLLSTNLNATTLYDIATDCTWEFSNGAGEILDANVKLYPNSTLSYTLSPNETTWEIYDGDLVLKNDKGLITTRFTQVEIDSITSQLKLSSDSGWHIFTCK